jgi:hypothetical protein
MRKFRRIFRAMPDPRADTRLERFAGWDLHPSAAFARRTPGTDQSPLPRNGARGVTCWIDPD